MLAVHLHALESIKSSPGFTDSQALDLMREALLARKNARLIAFREAALVRYHVRKSALSPPVNVFRKALLLEGEVAENLLVARLEAARELIKTLRNFTRRSRGQTKAIDCAITYPKGRRVSVVFR